MKKILITLLFFNLFLESFACINQYKTLLSGKVVLTDPSTGKIWSNEIDTLQLREKSNQLFESYKKTNSIEDLSDYGATLVYLGEYIKAKSIYQSIELRSPNLYTTASNLGTIYELIGKPDSALIWIKKSVMINPKSHDGSEWIHIKILEFKIAKKQEYLISILGLDFGDEAIPSNANNYNLELLQNQISHQLSERLNFVKPKNEIVGNIFYDYGNIIAQTSDVQAALESYYIAKEYGFESDLLDKRIIRFELLAMKAKPFQLLEENKDFIIDHFFIIAPIGFGLFILTIIIIVRLIRKKINGRRKITINDAN